ncbi:hypothetical protein B0H12DRAFT_1106170 [Mycena haematopus]|nr:hypothetical protein B0H12DRAFT_1106170 [Mycena haematopus]
MIAGLRLRLGNAPSGPASLRAVQLWCRGWLQGAVCPRVRRAPPQQVPRILGCCRPPYCSGFRSNYLVSVCIM